MTINANPQGYYDADAKLAEKDNLNALYHEHKGGCVHEWKPMTNIADLCKAFGTSSNLYDYFQCSKCKKPIKKARVAGNVKCSGRGHVCSGNRIGWVPNQEPPFPEPTPDHANDPAVFRDCVVKYKMSLKYDRFRKVWIASTWEITGNGQYLQNDYSDPNPNHAVIKAVLKMEKGVV